MTAAVQGGYRSAQETTSAIVPPEEPKANGKAAPGDAKKAGKVVFGGGNRLLAAKVPVADVCRSCPVARFLFRPAFCRLSAKVYRFTLQHP